MHKILIAGVMILKIIVADAQVKDSVFVADSIDTISNSVIVNCYKYVIMDDNGEPTWSFNGVKKGSNELYITCNDSLVIKGDTTKVIMWLIEKYFRDINARYAEADSAIKVCVDMSNTIPDYFKNTHQWRKFIKLIRGYGYREVPLKPKKKIPIKKN